MAALKGNFNFDLFNWSHPQQMAWLAPAPDKLCRYVPQVDMMCKGSCGADLLENELAGITNTLCQIKLHLNLSAFLNAYA